MIGWTRSVFLFLALLLTVTPCLAWASSFVEQPSGQRRLVVFVHGLGNSGDSDPLLAWSRHDRDKSWPVLMNREEAFKRNFAIFVAQYDTKHFRGNFHIQGLSSELKGILDVDAHIADYDEVYFIAHSLGGIVVRNLLIEDELIRNRTKGIFLFASPLGGSNIAAVARTLGLGSVQTMQLGSSPDDPDAVFNTLKDNWYREKIDIPSFCAYETEPTRGTMVVARSSVEPLCSQDVKPLRGAHTGIVQPPENGTFFAHVLVRNWMQFLLPDFDFIDSEKENQIVIANCSGNEAYRGPYGRVHATIQGLFKRNGIENVRYSLPLSQNWAGDGVTKQIFTKFAPSDVVIHLSCFQNMKLDSSISIGRRDENIINFLKSFKEYKTNIVIYSRAFARSGCGFFISKLRVALLADAYKGRLKLVGVQDGEMPGVNSSADRLLVSATSHKSFEPRGRVADGGCFH